MTLPSDDPQYVQWLEQQKARRHAADIAWLNQMRPEEFNVPGDMHPDVAEWFTRLVDPDQVAGNLIMCGNFGVGKTWHIWRLVSDLVEKYEAARHIEVVTAYQFKEIAAPETDYKTLHRFAEVQMLFLDDVGSLRLSNWDLEHVFAIVDQRLPRRRPTVISSNELDFQELLKNRIASRLAANTTIVEFVGEDRRRAS